MKGAGSYLELTGIELLSRKPPSKVWAGGLIMRYVIGLMKPATPLSKGLTYVRTALPRYLYIVGASKWVTCLAAGVIFDRFLIFRKGF